MKRLYSALMLACLVLASMNSFGQAAATSSSCGLSPSDAGSLVAPSSLDVDVSGATLPAVLTGYTGGLPDIEYAIIDPADIVFDEDSLFPGPRFLDASDDGVFFPSAYGFAPGDQFCVIGVSYDLAVVKNAVDVILNGSFLFTPCCALISTFVPDLVTICADLNAAGIFGPGDINDLNDVFDVVIALGGAPSFEALQNTIDVETNPLIDSGTPCTGGSAICYTLTAPLCYNVVGGGAPCSSPISGLNAVVDASGVTLSWNSGAADGVLGYLVCGSPAGSPGSSCRPPILEPATSTFIPSSFLTSGVTYEWEVTGGCALDGSILTPVSAPSTFTFLRKGMEPELTLAPNPVSTTLNIGGAIQGEYQVIDMAGRILKAGQNNESNLQLDVSDLNPGLYLVRIENGSELQQEQFNVIR
jgi:hypothetical protein